MNLLKDYQDENSASASTLIFFTKNFYSFPPAFSPI